MVRPPVAPPMSQHYKTLPPPPHLIELAGGRLEQMGLYSERNAPAVVHHPARHSQLLTGGVCCCAVTKGGRLLMAPLVDGWSITVGLRAITGGGAGQGRSNGISITNRLKSFGDYSRWRSQPGGAQISTLQVGGWRFESVPTRDLLYYTLLSGSLVLDVHHILS